MNQYNKSVIALSLYVLFHAAVLLAGALRANGDLPKQITIRVVAFADRWSDFGSRSNVPSFRDFVAEMVAINGQRVKERRIIKVRLHYSPVDKSDPAPKLTERSREWRFELKRYEGCDETVKDLQQKDPATSNFRPDQPSRLIVVPGAKNELLPSPETLLSCYHGWSSFRESKPRKLH